MANHSFLLAAPESTLSQAPTTGEVSADRFFRSLAAVAASLVLLLVAYIVWKIGGQALPAIERFHVGFLTSSDWNVQTEKFGVLPAIWGTLYSSLLALIVGGFFGLMVAIFLTQDFLPKKLAFVFRLIVEMLAAIPSVVFGLWGIFVVIPFIRPPPTGSTKPWLAPVLLQFAVGPWSAAGSDRSRHHDPADHRGDLAGRAQRRALPHQGSGVRHGCHSLGSDLARDGTDGGWRHLLRDGARLRPGTRARPWHSPC